MIATRRFRPIFEYVAANYVWRSGPQKIPTKFPGWEGKGPRSTAAPAAAWLEAVALHESVGNAMARRYEPHQDAAGRTDAPTDPDLPGVDDAQLEDDASYGLMQVMGYNWRKIIGAPVGTPLRFGILFDPLVNIRAGCDVLTWELEATGGDVARTLARYNGGPTGENLRGGQMRTQGYVDKVARALLLVLHDRALVGIESKA